MKCDCCYDTNLYFDTYGDCEDFGGQLHTISTHKSCKITICNDGKFREGHYCGYGPCNMFGCNCERGCRGGLNTDALDAFKKRYSWRVFNVRSNLQPLADPSTN